MNLTERFLQELRARGVELRLEGDRLRCIAPKGTLDGPLQAELTRRKPELMRWLKSSGEGGVTRGPVLKRVPRSGTLPLSFGQERLWFLHQMDPQSPAYNLPSGRAMKGLLDPAVLARVLEEMARRHEILRTTFPQVDGHPVPVIAATPHVPLSVVDLRGCPESSWRADVERLGKQALHEPFDLARGPLWRALLLQVPGDRSILWLTLHHIASDGWSVALIQREWEVLYHAFAGGQSSPLPEPELQYVDYAVWERARLTADLLERQLDYWRRQLAGPRPVLELCTDRPRPAVQRFQGEQHLFSLPPSLRDELKALSLGEGATLFMTLLTAFKVLLFRYTGQTDLLVGVANGSRPHLALERMPGFFVNTQVMRTSLHGDPPFREALARVKAVVLEACVNQDVPFERLVADLQPTRDLSRSPLFQAMFTLQNTPLEQYARQALFEGIASGSTAGAKCDLSLFVIETTRGLDGQFEYPIDLFESATIARLAGHFRTLLEAVVTDPAQRISALPLLSAQEQRELSVEENLTRPAVEAEGWLPDLVENQVARTPGATAVTGAGRPMTYAEVNRRANQLARHLQRLGVGPEVTVGICVERSADLLVGLLAILKAGGAYVPLDPTHPAERLAFVVAETRLTVLLTQASLRPRLPSGGGAQILCLDATSSSWVEESAENPVRDLRADNLAYVVYTSGSTGRPKGIMISHRGLANYLRWCVRAYRVAEGTGALVHSSLAFDLTITGLFAPLLVGGAVHLVPEDDPLGAVLTAWRAKPDFSLVKITPRHLEALSQQLSPAEAGGATRACIIGGESLSAASLRFWQAHAPATRLINEYGPAETVVGCCVYEVPPGESVGEWVPIGRPIANTQLYVLDGRAALVPPGVRGELYIAGDGLARGYLDRPDLTAERFLPNPFSPEPGGRMYRSGDLGRQDGSRCLWCLGRADHQVKIRGYRVEPEEIEGRLRVHPDLQEAVVVARESGQGDLRLVAYVVARSGRQPSVSELRSYLSQALPAYMIPGGFEFLAALPLSPNGKVDRQALPVPTPARPALDTNYEAPRTALEQAVASIWSEVLGVSQPGRRDPFFDLGGHSLLLIQVQAKLRDGLGIELPLLELFRYPTVESLARRLSAANPAPVPGPSLRPSPSRSPAIDTVRRTADPVVNGHPMKG
jgi:amino acid adenylation domain-containing protein